jgi:dTDP-4-dehydrorhamnose 3,5-epimerase
MPLKIVSVTELDIPAIKVIRFARFGDHRGYFTETFRKSDFRNHPLTPFMRGVEFSQTNESYSKAGTIRGLHFQWNPYMGKLVRTVQGHLVDLALDIRLGSPTFGKIVAHDMPSQRHDDFNDWIWVPPGFAHGTLLLQDTALEYYCSGEYSPGCEAAISPLAEDIDWRLCDPKLRTIYERIVPTTSLVTDKDKNGFTLAAWQRDERSRNFIHTADD